MVKRGGGTGLRAGGTKVKIIRRKNNLREGVPEDAASPISVKTKVLDFKRLGRDYSGRQEVRADEQAAGEADGGAVGFGV